MHPAIMDRKTRLLNRYGERLAHFIVHGSYLRGKYTPVSKLLNERDKPPQ